MKTMIMAATLSLVFGRGVARDVIVIEMGAPVTVQPGVEFRAVECIKFGKVYNVTKVWSFIGTDRGNLVEADMQLSSPTGDYFMQRSDHREVAANYDAWKSEATEWAGDAVCVQISAHSTNDKPIRVHFQARLEARK